ncbi:F-BAR and double SH3 domains protein 2-like isoform X1 [Simochromis diagramma]|uniref:F-BAR and double SH3 domains protein 2-like isoform X1 n=1 Tax=Simochromis diagramma TaxID=43689 RepID=UPI001A7E6366|nr:F-BAR and double SH3 domains protein 2-like isoform X1 [Simochromis diagramma]
MEVARQSLRRAETVKAKAEARLDLLREAGVPVETWLKSAMNQVMEELENKRWNNLSTHDPSLSVTADLEREDEEEMEDSGEVLDDSSSSPSSTLKNYPLTCKVLYSYKWGLEPVQVECASSPITTDTTDRRQLHTKAPFTVQHKAPPNPPNTRRAAVAPSDPYAPHLRPRSSILAGR